MKKKQIFITLTAMALTAALTIGGTLAYLSAITETKTNVFSSDKGIEIDIIEKKWEETGKTKASEYVPGDVIAKDPTIIIEEGSAWVGMRLDFCSVARDDKTITYMPYGKIEGDVKKGFRSYAEHDGINEVEGWTLIAKNGKGSELYAYSTKLVSGNEINKTEPIFDNVIVNASVQKYTETELKSYFTKTTTINKETGEILEEKLKEVTTPPTTTTMYFDQNGNAVEFDKLPSFEIKGTGYAVQGDNVELEEAKTEIIKLANTKIDLTSEEYFYAVQPVTP